mmetsp:Transcript_7014/g.16866  ORF Transcript_7014/g.16866 Transcript_7014/m.16866 type:complete len:244 (-) Transcript_7014:195-926(-)
MAAKISVRVQRCHRGSWGAAAAAFASAVGLALTCVLRCWRCCCSACCVGTPFPCAPEAASRSATLPASPRGSVPRAVRCSPHRMPRPAARAAAFRPQASAQECARRRSCASSSASSSASASARRPQAKRLRWNGAFERSVPATATTRAPPTRGGCTRNRHRQLWTTSGRGLSATRPRSCWIKSPRWSTSRTFSPQTRPLKSSRGGAEGWGRRGRTAARSAVPFCEGRAHGPPSPPRARRRGRR